MADRFRPVSLVPLSCAFARAMISVFPMELDESEVGFMALASPAETHF
jgi:hypothetical protein